MDRVYGPDLMLALCQRAAERGWRNYFYGGKEGTAEALARRLEERFPGLVVVGTESPPFRAADAGGARRRDGPHPRGPARPRVGRPQHAQAGALDGGARRSSRGAGAARCRRRVRHPRRDAEAGARLDAALGTRVALPPVSRAPTTVRGDISRTTLASCSPWPDGRRGSDPSSTGADRPLPGRSRRDRQAGSAAPPVASASAWPSGAETNRLTARPTPIIDQNQIPPCGPAR